jgi:hypothetical protein
MLELLEHNLKVMNHYFKFNLTGGAIDYEKQTKKKQSRNLGMVSQNRQLLHRLFPRLPVLLRSKHGHPIQTSHSCSMAT